MSSSTCAIVSFVSIWAASFNVIYIKKDHRHQFCSVPVQCNPCQLIPSVNKTKLRRSYFPVRAIRKSFPLLPLNSQYNADKDVVASVHHGWVRIVWPSSLPLPFSPPPSIAHKCPVYGPLVFKTISYSWRVPGQRIRRAYPRWTLIMILGMQASRSA